MKFPIAFFCMALGILHLADAPARAAEPLAVEIVEASKSGLERRFSLTGEIRAKDSLTASFSVGGRVVEVLTEVGNRVEEGEALARLDSIQQELAIRTAEAGLTTAKADYRQAIEDFERAKSLLASGAATRAARDAAEDHMLVTQGALEQAEAERDRSIKALADTVLRAPSSSTVISRMIEPGQIIGAAQPAMELALDKGYEAVFEIPEVLLIKAPTDTSATVKEIELALLSSPDALFKGLVTEVSPLVDARTGTVRSRVEVLDPPEGIGYGEPVRGTAVLNEDAVVRLPFEAVSATAQGPAVWKVDRDSMKVSLHQVEVSRYATGFVLISEGVDDGDWVVTKGAQLLYPGRTVRRAEATQ